MLEQLMRLILSHMRSSLTAEPLSNFSNIPKYLRSQPPALTAGQVTPLFGDLIWPEIINQRQCSGPHTSKLKHFAPSQHLEQSRVITVQGNQQYRVSQRDLYFSCN